MKFSLCGLTCVALLTACWSSDDDLLLDPLADAPIEDTSPTPPPDSVPGLPPAGGMPGATLYKGVHYRVDVHQDHGAPAGIVIYVSGLRVVDSSRSETVPLGRAACYRVIAISAEDAGRTWSAAPPAECAAPTTAQQAHRTFSASDILGDTLPVGTYDFRVQLPLDDTTLILAAGRVFLAADKLPPIRDFRPLRFAGDVGTARDGIQYLTARIAVTNTGSRRVQFDYGACVLDIHLFDNAQLKGTPVWRSEYRQPPGGTSSYACLLYGASAVLAPGQSASPGEFSARFPITEILADSLPARRYYAQARLRLSDHDNRTSEVFAFDGGAVDLDRTVTPLPGSRTVGQLRYSGGMGLLRVGSDTLRFHVTIRNTSAEAAAAVVPRECPIIAYAYSSAERQAGLEPGRPQWQDGGCRVNLHYFTLQPGQSWSFVRDVSVARMRATTPPGTYHFSLVMHTPTRVVILNAGTFTLPP